MSGYVFDQAWQAERDRLGALDDLFNEATFYRLTALGLGAGWRCLEVGGGAGGVARWLAEAVGPSGQVVATDLDPRFIEASGIDNLEVRRHDIVNDPLEEGVFDLTHARAVLEHIPERERALERMVAATRPGGWVVIEDSDFGGPMIPVLLRYQIPVGSQAPTARLMQAVAAMFRGAGADATLGPRLPGMLRAAGLANAGAELHGRYVWGGTARDFGRLTVEHLRGHMVRLGLVTDEEIERFLEENQKSEWGYIPITFVTAWGQRPVE